MKRVAYWIATGLGSGLSPKAPGTAGSVLGLLIYVVVARLEPRFQSLVILVTLAVAFWAVAKFQKGTSVQDDQRIVIDEVLGIWITLFAIPMSPIWWGIGLILFRGLDILKPFPADWADRKIPGAAGVILDDVFAGIYAQALLRVAMVVWGTL